MKQSMSNQRGFSMIELMIVVVIIGIMTGLATPHFGRVYARMKLRAAARDIGSDFRLARSKAISSKEQFGLYFDQSTRTITLFHDKTNPTSYKFESSDSVIFVDTLPVEYVSLSTDCTNNVIAFKPNGAAAFSGGGNLTTIAVSSEAVCIGVANVLASTGRVTNNIYVY